MKDFDEILIKLQDEVESRQLEDEVRRDREKTIEKKTISEKIY